MRLYSFSCPSKVNLQHRIHSLPRKKYKKNHFNKYFHFLLFLKKLYLTAFNFLYHQAPWNKL